MLVVTLLQHIAALVALAVVFDLIADRIPDDRRVRAAISGALFGLIAVAGILTPVRLDDGILFDGRSVILTAAGYIAGPVPALIASVIAGSARWAIGGAGTPAGVTLIVVSAAAGSLAYRARLRWHAWNRWWAVLALGVFVHVVMLLILPVFLPGADSWGQVRRTATTVLTVFPLAFLLIVHVFFSQTVRRNTARAVRESEARYRALFENRHAPMLVLRPADGRIVDANEAAVNLYGWRREELVTMHVSDLNTSAPADIREAFRRALLAEERRFEFVHRRRDGSLIDVEISSGAVRVHGEELLYSIIHDVTKENLRNRELAIASQSVEHAAIAVFRIAEPDARIHYVNGQACASLGYTRAELLSMTILDVDPTFSLERWKAHREEVHRTGGRTFETIHRRKDGVDLNVEVTVSTIWYRGERMSVSFARDITDRVRSERALKRSLEEKHILLREVHHRVRNNLAVINGLINLQIDRLDSPEDYREAIEKTRDRIMVMGMIHDRLYQDDDLGHIDFVSFLGQIALHLQMEYGHTRTADVRVPEGELQLDVALALPLGLIVSESITNAFAHAFPSLGDAPTGDAPAADGASTASRGAIDVTADGETNGEIVVEIRDNGVGIREGLDVEHSGNLGFQLMRSLSLQIGAEVSIMPRVDGGGTVVRVAVPVAGNGTAHRATSA